MYGGSPCTSVHIGFTGSGQALDAPVSKGAVIIEVQETVKKTGNSHSVDQL